MKVSNVISFDTCCHHEEEVFQETSESMLHGLPCFFGFDMSELVEEPWAKHAILAQGSSELSPSHHP